MEKSLKLILTDSYFNIFPLLINVLEGKTGGLKRKNIIFSEEKISLMTERWLCGSLKGSFNTDVYSFGNFLRAKKRISKSLSKEGSAMAVKRVLNGLSLKCFRSSKTYLAPALFDLIAQLKSAKVGVSDLERAITSTNGVLKNKLADVIAVYREYEDFLSNNGYDDQSSALSYLPELIESQADIKDTDVYLLGYTSLTVQARSAISTLLDNANSVTAILTRGDNDFMFVNETERALAETCAKKGVRVERSYYKSEYTAEGKMLIDSAFNPLSGWLKKGKIQTDKIYANGFKNIDLEITAVAEQIKSAVLDGECRWKDMTVALSDATLYRDKIERIFNLLDIPYFLDEKKQVERHPLITLILAYIDSFRKGLERGALASFYKNPIFTADKELADDFENYLLKFNVNRSNVKKEFTLESDSRPLEELEKFRQNVCAYFNKFDIRGMLNGLRAEDTLSALANRLKEAGEDEQSAITAQIYGAVTKILDEMDVLLDGVDLPLAEYKNVFLSGVSAMDLSIIPQYADAVFVGGFKETALAKAKRLFVCGLTSAVPNVQKDVALLSDKDIDVLDGVSVLVEPKIRVVNHRARENAGMAISAFGERLYLSYPISGGDGASNVKSELFSLAEKLFTVKPFGEIDGYLTEAQGVNTFAMQCGRYVTGLTEDFVMPSSFSKATDGAYTGEILKRARKELKERLDGKRKNVIGGEISASVLEDYHECPYRAFVKHGLKLKDRETSEMAGRTAGNFFHEVLKGYVDEIDTVNSKVDSDALFYRVAEKVLLSSDYKKFLHEKDSSVALTRLINECRNYCYKTYLSLKEKYFTCKTEVGFGDGTKNEYGAIKLLGGKVKLKGKIDRVDTGEKYYRIIDYKTGKTDASDASLFCGTKLQLYLYAKAVGEKEKDKSLVGAYYMPISDNYTKPDEEIKLATGKTLEDEEAILAQDKEFFNKGGSSILPLKTHKSNGKLLGASTAEGLSACMDYAVRISEKSAEQMLNGVIIPSPLEGACKYCEYKPLCGYYGVKERTLDGVTEKTFIGATGEKLSKEDTRDE